MTTQTLGIDPVDISVVVSSSQDSFWFTPQDARELRDRFLPNIRINYIPTPHNATAQANAAEFVTVELVFGASLLFVIGKLFESFAKDAGSDLYKYVKEHFFGNVKTPPSSNVPTVGDLLSDLVARNKAHSYRVYQTIILVCVLNDEHVRVKIDINDEEFEQDENYNALRDAYYSSLDGLDASDPEDFETWRILVSEYAASLRNIGFAILDKKIRALARDWDSIERDIARYHLGFSQTRQSPPSKFHIIQKIVLPLGPEGRTKWIIKALDDDRNRRLFRD